MMLFRIKVNSGKYAGRYVGPLHVAGCRSDWGLTDNPEVPVPEAGVSLCVQEEFALRFFSPDALQIELKSLGFDTGLVAAP